MPKKYICQITSLGSYLHFIQDTIAKQVTFQRDALTCLSAKSVVTASERIPLQDRKYIAFQEICSIGLFSFLLIRVAFFSFVESNRKPIWWFVQNTSTWGEDRINTRNTFSKETKTGSLIVRKTNKYNVVLKSCSFALFKTALLWEKGHSRLVGAKSSSRVWWLPG